MQDEIEQKDLTLWKNLLKVTIEKTLINSCFMSLSLSLPRFSCLHMEVTFLESQMMAHGTFSLVFLLCLMISPELSPRNSFPFFGPFKIYLYISANMSH